MSWSVVVSRATPLIVVSLLRWFHTPRYAAMSRPALLLDSGFPAATLICSDMCVILSFHEGPKWVGFMCVRKEICIVLCPNLQEILIQTQNYKRV